MGSDGASPGAVPAGDAKLRVGLLLPAGDPPAWVAQIVRDLQASTVATLVAVVQRATPEAPAAEPLATRLLRGAYHALDARVFKLARDPFAPVAIADALGAARVIQMRADEHADDALAKLAALRLDVAVELGFGRLTGRALSIARHGVWAYQHGDAQPSLGGPAGFSEVMTHAPVTTSALLRLTPDGDEVLYQSWSSTDPTSVRRNRARTYWKSATFVTRALRALHERVTAASVSPAPSSPSSTRPLSARSASALSSPTSSSTTPAWSALSSSASSSPAASSSSSASAVVSSAASAAAPAAPGGGRVAAGLARFGAGVVRDRAHRMLTRKQWLLAFGIDRALTGDVPSQALGALRWLVPPRDRFWADPFVAPHGDGWVVVFEEKLYAERNARISALEIDRDGVVGASYPVLERDYHLSYPFLLRWNDTWWMIPESSRNRTIDLWRATDFPRRWALERTLIEDISAVDATLIEHAGRWWMFCNIGEPGASKDDELHLFHAATPLGPWTPHPQNPIKSDIRGARPAGRPFWTDGAWHRPAQDSSAGYGSSLVLQRIDRLDERGYAESEHARLAPRFAPGLIGMHTINAADGLTVIDLRLERSRLALFDRVRSTGR